MVKGSAVMCPNKQYYFVQKIRKESMDEQIDCVDCINMTAFSESKHSFAQSTDSYLWQDKRVICGKEVNAGFKRIIANTSVKNLIIGFAIEDHNIVNYEDENIKSNIIAICKCPDGQEYYVNQLTSENNENCESFACENGTLVGCIYSDKNPFIDKFGLRKTSVKCGKQNLNRFIIGHYDNERDSIVGVFKSELDQGDFVAMYQKRNKFDKIVFKFTSAFNTSIVSNYKSSSTTNKDQLNYFSSINQIITASKKIFQTQNIFYDPLFVHSFWSNDFIQCKFFFIIN